jgi:hypothetical protein
MLERIIEVRYEAVWLETMSRVWLKPCNLQRLILCDIRLLGIFGSVSALHVREECLSRMLLANFGRQRGH